MAVVYNYQEILFKRPQSVHMWRQADCLSITANYYQDNNAFLQPGVHNLCDDGNGKTVSDFPLIYYTVSKLWKIFGQHEFIYRALILLLWFIGLLALFKLSESLLRDSVVSLFVALLLFTSPTLVYYGNNFLMNMPAFSLALVGMYFFFRFYRSQHFSQLLLSVLFYALAGLLKTPSLMSFLAIVGVFGLELVGLKIKKDGKVFPQPLKTALTFALVPVVLAVWYGYAHQYNSENCAGIFLVGILPIWELDWPQIHAHLDAIREHMKWDYLRFETEMFLVSLFILMMVFWKKADRLLLLLTLILSVGFVLYCALFFQPLKDHDYYTINLFIMIPMVLLTAISQFKNLSEKGYNSWIFRILLLAFLIHNVDFARRRVRSRYSANSPVNEQYRNHYESLTRIRPYLNQIGVEPGDHIVFLSDPSINISLYFMNQKGWTNYNTSSNPEKLEMVRQMGAKYIFVFEDEKQELIGFEPFLTDKVGQFENIGIYTL